MRLVSSVQPDTINGRTLVTWSEGLGGGASGPAKQNPKFYALRQRASLFGYNAINPLHAGRQRRRTALRMPVL